jgi:hypothetical protein
MKKQKIVKAGSRLYIFLSALCLLLVSLQAWYNPQMVMDLIGVQLSNNDASSSIRGVYGGAGLTIYITLIYLMKKDVAKGLMFLSIFWGLYAFSRILTVFADGQLGGFGNQWLKIESFLFLLGLVLLMSYHLIIKEKKLQHEKI